MNKEHSPKTGRFEHKKRKRMGAVLGLAYIATSLHFFPVESETPQVPTSQVELAQPLETLPQLPYAPAPVVGAQEPATPPPTTRLLPIVDAIYESAREQNEQLLPDYPFSCEHPLEQIQYCGDPPAQETQPVVDDQASEPPPSESLHTPEQDGVAQGVAPYNPYYDQSLSAEQKWMWARQLAAESCPSGSLGATSYEVVPQFGEDTDGLLGYTNPNTLIISVDVRPKHRPVDVAETILHEQMHGRDEDGKIDRRQWLDALGLTNYSYVEDELWYFGPTEPMSPGEALARLTPPALLGVDVMNESLANSGYGANPDALQLLRQASSAHIHTAGILSGCFS